MRRMRSPLRSPLSRRTVVRGLAGLSLPLLAGCRRADPAAPPAALRRVAYLYLYRDGPSRPYEEPFRARMHELGWVEGRTVSITVANADGSPDRLAELTAETIRAGVDVIVAPCTPEARVFQRVTTAVPIVLAASGDLVAAQLVQSLARPGGNITGLSAFFPEQSGKRLDLLKQIFPAVTQAALIWNPLRPDNRPELDAMHAAAQALGIALRSLPVEQLPQIDGALESALTGGADALLTLGDLLVASASERITSFAARHRLPALYEDRFHVEGGGLMAYGPNFPGLHRRAAEYVDKILKGTHPADLPIEKPSQFEFVINLATARTLGFTILPAVLAQADEVIQ